MRRAAASSAMARSIAAPSSWSRSFMIAELVLLKIFATSSAPGSPIRTWLCRTGTAAVRPEASLSLKSDRPCMPSERQKRITVGWLTSALAAISATGSLSTVRGCSSTRLATRRSAGLRLSMPARMRSSSWPESAWSCRWLRSTSAAPRRLVWSDSTR